MAWIPELGYIGVSMAIHRSTTFDGVAAIWEAIEKKEKVARGGDSDDDADADTDDDDDDEEEEEEEEEDLDEITGCFLDEEKEEEEEEDIIGLSVQILRIFAKDSSSLPALFLPLSLSPKSTSSNIPLLLSLLYSPSPIFKNFLSSPSFSFPLFWFPLFWPRIIKGVGGPTRNNESS